MNVGTCYGKTTGVPEPALTTCHHHPHLYTHDFLSILQLNKKQKQKTCQWVIFYIYHRSLWTNFSLMLIRTTGKSPLDEEELYHEVKIM